MKNGAFVSHKDGKCPSLRGDLDAIERIVFSLRSIYSANGYKQFRMGKFEEYDFYARNKDFLVSDSVITFTDTNGKLMALKPDVTLSIVRSTDDADGIRKLYYDENVYRVSKGTGSFREIKQTGLECIGAVDSYCVGEVLMLAAQSLAAASDGFVLDVSHLGILAAFIAQVSDSPEVCARLLKCVGEKNTHGISEICRENGIPQENAAPLRELATLYGGVSEAIAKLKAIKGAPDISAELAELEDALAIFGDGENGANIRIDFSVVGDVNYYNGIVFKGFIDGIPESVLSGGRYDRLMEKLGRRSRAVGFAVYLDMLERLEQSPEPYDVDILLIGGDDAAGTRRAAEALIAEGRSVLVAGGTDVGVRYRALARYADGEVKIIENDA